jgi:hypothetical protein
MGTADIPINTVGGNMGKTDFINTALDQICDREFHPGGWVVYGQQHITGEGHASFFERRFFSLFGCRCTAIQ